MKTGVGDQNRKLDTVLDNLCLERMGISCDDWWTI